MYLQNKKKVFFCFHCNGLCCFPPPQDVAAEQHFPNTDGPLVVYRHLWLNLEKEFQVGPSTWDPLKIMEISNIMLRNSKVCIPVQSLQNTFFVLLYLDFMFHIILLLVFCCVWIYILYLV